MALIVYFFFCCFFWKLGMSFFCVKFTQKVTARVLKLQIKRKNFLKQARFLKVLLDKLDEKQNRGF